MSNPLDTVIFDGKTSSDVFKEIYNNSKKKAIKQRMNKKQEKKNTRMPAAKPHTLGCLVGL